MRLRDLQIAFHPNALRWRGTTVAETKPPDLRAAVAGSSGVKLMEEPMIKMIRLAPVMVVLTGCAMLQGFGIQAPHFRQAVEQQSHLRLLAPTGQQPLGGAALRLYVEVENPNPVGLTLATLGGDLFLEGVRAAGVNLPLGLAMRAGERTVVPIDISLSFADLPGLADAALRAVTGSPLDYRLEGIVGVDAGRLGQPSFGPMTIVQGEVRAFR
jgi:hypothetical protein